MVRSTIFWIHLVCGVVTGLVVLMMSVTGVILTYERQILAWADRTSYPAPSPGAQRLALEELVEAAKLRRPEFAPTTIALRNEPDAPVVLGAGRNGQLFVDPYSGEVRDPGGQGLRSFFSAVTGWHRWFNVQGEGRAFFINQDGDILATAQGAYSGDRRPDAYAAFKEATGLKAPLATSHASSKGTDQHVWKSIG